MQNAFTELARAYDTLKDDKAREVYDFKLRKYLEYVQDDKESGRKTGASLDETENARYEFERGFEYLMDDNYDDALPYLTRAAQMSPNNARYRAYFGKVLSGYESERHKAEAELQAAEKLTLGAQQIEQHPVALELRRMQMLSEIGIDNNTTTVVLIPSEFSQAAKSFAEMSSKNK